MKAPNDLVSPNSDMMMGAMETASSKKWMTMGANGCVFSKNSMMMGTIGTISSKKRSTTGAICRHEFL